MKEEIFNLLQYSSLQELKDIKKEIERRIALKLERERLVKLLWPDKKE